ncbi:SAM-dependent methyltransferase, partial [Alphaproteobacteria bacterium]|nr:SAM-dependent methyltransferase [Alphaproteobacteria bacterium]
KKPNLFAKEYIPTLRSWSEATFVSGLSPQRSINEKQEIVDVFYNNYQKFVEEFPEGHGMDYVHCYLMIKKEG